MNRQSHRRVILVIGIIRSGTSAITKGLSTMGVSLLPIPSFFTPSDSFNAKGYWEDIDVKSLNTKMLKSLSVRKSYFRNFLPITEAENNYLYDQGFFTQASELLCKKLSASQPLGIKDPLITLLLPFWKRVFQASDISPSFVIALRNPINVVASISRFTEQSSEESCWKFFWMWVSFLLSCVEYAVDDQSIIVDYQELLKNPASQMKRVAHALNLKIDHDLVKNYSDDFIDSALCHFKSSSEVQNSNPPLQREHGHYLDPHFLINFSIEMYHQLLAAAQDRIPFSQLKEALEPWKKEFLLVKPLLCLAEKNEWDIQLLRNKVIKSETELNKRVTENLMIKTQLSLKIYQSHVKDLMAVNRLWNHTRHE
jgi:hypothetical protein